MGRAKTVSVVSGVVLRNALGLSDGNLKDRSVTAKNKDGEPLAYDLSEVVSKCHDLIVDFLIVDIESEEAMEKLNIEKRKEEIRKLKIDNDKEEKVLVPSSDVSQTFTRGLKSIVDMLDPLVGIIKMENPDCPSYIIDSLNTNLSKIRNKIADIGLNDG